MEARRGDVAPETAAAWQASTAWKRPLDLALASAASLVALPLVAVIALWIRLDSRGPIFFRQERVGRDGGRFRMWKFRSMYVNSADMPHRAAAEAWFAARPAADGYKPRSDPRVTPVGRFIRRTSLDELPQLLNVLSGDMSLVGPRPAIPYELEHYQPSYFERQRVKPGMTGLWQVSGRDSISAQEMMALDLRYVRGMSLRLDLEILARTVPAVAGRRRRHA